MGGEDRCCESGSQGFDQQIWREGEFRLEYDASLDVQDFVGQLRNPFSSHALQPESENLLTGACGYTFHDAPRNLP